METNLKNEISDAQRTISDSINLASGSIKSNVDNNVTDARGDIISAIDAAQDYIVDHFFHPDGDASTSSGEETTNSNTGISVWFVGCQFYCS